MGSSVAAGTVTEGFVAPDAVDRRFEAVVLDWDAATGERPEEAADLADLLERLMSLGLDVALMTRGPVDGVRPGGPGRLYTAVDPDGEVAEVTGDGVRPLGVTGVLTLLWARGIDPGAVFLTADEAAKLRPVLTDQLRRRERGEMPYVNPPQDWRLDVIGFDPHLERVHEALLTLTDGRLGTRGSPLVGNGASAPTVLYSGAYEGTAGDTELARLPHWSRLAESEELHPVRRTLDLRAGLLYEEGPVTSVRFSSLARPATVAVRARGERALLPGQGRSSRPGLVTQVLTDRHNDDGGLERLGAYDPDPRAAESALAAAEQAG
jgi:hypothetical protein